MWLALCANFLAKTNIVLTTHIQNVYKVYQVFWERYQIVARVEQQHAVRLSPWQNSSDY
jgi:hypothetical protein